MTDANIFVSNRTNGMLGATATHESIFNDGSSCLFWLIWSCRVSGVIGLVARIAETTQVY